MSRRRRRLFANNSTSSWATWDGSKDGAFTSVPTSGDMDDICQFDTGRSLVAYLDSSTGQINVIVATTSGTTVAYPTIPKAIDPAANFQATLAALDTSRVLVCYSTVVGIYAVVVLIDGSNNIGINTPRLIAASTSIAAPRVLKLAADQCILTYLDESVVQTFSATIVTTVGISVDNPHAILPVDAYVPAIYNVTPLSTTSAFIAYNSDDAGNGVQGIQLTITANTVSAFSSQNIVPSSVTVQSLLTCQAIDATHIVVAYGDDNAALGKAFIVTITDGSGNMIFGSSVDFNTGAVAGNMLGSSNPLCFIDPATMMIFFTSESAPISGNACILAINGTTVAPYSPVQLALGNYSNLLGVLLNPNQILSGGSMNPTGGAGTQILSIV